MSNNKEFAPGKSEVLVPELHFPEYMNQPLSHTYTSFYWK
ncbi:hypothetical protein SAMN04489724_0060 [Algoriphagus locisalis]|uniref:Uncharacterized protein n=1 Tax=Algoriphagus locisalis TaxID=305507 RepID=A0A1I7E4N9_9BACT|nr:hypothetical protein SAMN04489724_0060 [Algoriphagus locisalis]